MELDREISYQDDAQVEPRMYQEYGSLATQKRSSRIYGRLSFSAIGVGLICLFALTGCPDSLGVDEDQAQSGEMTAGVVAGEQTGGSAGEDAGDMAGDEAGETAGDEAGETAGDEAGETAGEEAGTAAGEEAGTAAGEEAGTAAGEVAGEQAGDELMPCVEPVTVSNTSFAALPFSLITFEVTGGSGDLVFTIEEGPSGGVINESTGAYLAGDLSGVTDRVRITDRSCADEVLISIDIVQPMQVLPGQPSVPRGQTVRFEVSEGSGEYEFSWLDNHSGGELSSDGTYYSGDTFGQDRIQVRDTRTGEVMLVLVQVVTRITVNIEPSLSWIPVGSSQDFRAAGGSGVFDFEWVSQRLGATAPTLTSKLDEVSVQAVESGSGVLVVRDRFLGVETRATVQQLRSLQYRGVRAGKDHRESKLLAWTDQDDDGIKELIFASSEPDVGAAEAGAVYIYSSATGAVTQRLSSGELRGRFGRQIAVGDWSGDGVSDLVVSAYLADRGRSGDVGAVYIYEGRGDGTVDPEHRQVMYGTRGSEQSGTGLALCDFNGDQRLDLAIGSWLGEIPGQANNQGVIRVYLGRPDGFPSEPDQVISGRSLTQVEESGEWSWTPRGDHRIGYNLSAGDLDGDGRCDLAASSYTTRGTLNINNSGEVHVYRGLATLGDPPLSGPDGGLTTRPVAAITPRQEDGRESRFGWRLLMIDRNADGRSELLVSQPRCDINANDAGAVYLYMWDQLPDAPADSYLTTADAQEVLRGTSGSEYFGYSLAAGDFDGDPNLDLAIGGYGGEVSGGPTNAGKLNLFLYSDETQTYESAPAHVMSGLNTNDNLGESVAILGPQTVASFAFGVDELGPNVGQPYWGELVMSTEAEGEESFELTPLAYEAQVGYARFGNDFDLSDEGRDGVLDVVVGAPYHPTESVSTVRSGAGFIYQITDVTAQATPDQDPLMPTQSLEGFLRHSGYDELGEGAQFIGDFDGDGWGDLAINARLEEQPTSFGSQERVDSGGCPSRQNDAGAVYIFRGQAGGEFAAAPSFVIYGQLRSEYIDVIDGRVDMNNDQRSDLIIGTRFADPTVNGMRRNDAGRAAIFLGRPAPTDGRRLVICEADVELLGEANGSYMGWSVSAIGDLNQDGCGEVAFGQPNLAVDGRNRQGSVRIIYGWGPGCFSDPRMLSLTVEDTDARFGTSISAADLDLDGRSDIVIGGYNARVEGERRGVVWIIRASTLETLGPRLLDQDPIFHDVSGYVGSQGEWLIGGPVNLSQFGWSVAAASGYVLVGIPRLGEGGDYSGGAYLYQIGRSGVEGLRGVFGGENLYGDGQLGLVVDLHRDGEQAWVGVGSLWGRGTHAQGGSVYVGSFTP